MSVLVSSDIDKSPREWGVRQASQRSRELACHSSPWGRALRLASMLPASGSAVDQRSPNQGDRESPVETWGRRQGGVHCSRALLLQKAHCEGCRWIEWLFRWVLRFRIYSR